MPRPNENCKLCNDNDKCKALPWEQGNDDAGFMVCQNKTNEVLCPVFRLFDGASQASKMIQDVASCYLRGDLTSVAGGVRGLNDISEVMKHGSTALSCGPPWILLP